MACAPCSSKGWFWRDVVHAGGAGLLPEGAQQVRVERSARTDRGSARPHMQRERPAAARSQEDRQRGRRLRRQATARRAGTCCTCSFSLHLQGPGRGHQVGDVRRLREGTCGLCGTRVMSHLHSAPACPHALCSIAGPAPAQVLVGTVLTRAEWDAKCLRSFMKVRVLSRRKLFGSASACAMLTPADRHASFAPQGAGTDEFGLVTTLAHR